MSRGRIRSGSSVSRCLQAAQEKIDWGWGGWGMKARDQGGGDFRQEIMGGDCEGSESWWNCDYTWKVEPSGGADRLGVG